MYSYPKNPPIPLTAAQHKAVPRMLLLPEAAVLLRKRAPARRGRAGAARRARGPPRSGVIYTDVGPLPIGYLVLRSNVKSGRGR